MLATIAVVAIFAGPVAATEKADVMAPVHQFIDGFNKGDVKTALAACADQTSIIDEFAPFEWHGAGACANWANDFDADAKKNGITDGFVTVGTPRHVDVAGDRAYVVVPTNYVFKQKGKPVKETGSTMTIALQKGATGWHIVGWAWAKK
jgi:enoyl reductase-like protein